MRLAQPLPSSPAPFSTRLAGRKLVLARSIWAALFALFVGLFLLGSPIAFQHASVLSDTTRQELIARGINPNFPALYLITLDTVTMLAFAAIALFIVLRQPDDWMVMLSSLTLVGTAMLYTIAGHDAPVPYWIPALAIALGEIFQVSFVYLFPLGQFIPRWLGLLVLPMFIWRPAIWVISYLPNYLATTRTAENYGTLRQDGLDTALMLSLFAIGIGAQVYRYRRVYNRTQQLQTKWVLWGILIAVVVTGTYIVIVNALGLLSNGGANELLLRISGRTIRQIALFMVPLTLAFSILRYRLWDIDVLLRRTLIYAPLTAILAGLFAALVPLAQSITVAFTGQESIVATIVATMIVVAAIEPVKQTIQTLVDKKFDETPDAHQHLEKFGERVQKRLSAVRPRQILRRFTDEAITAFQADGGATFFVRESKLESIYTRGVENQDTRLTIPVHARGKQVGAIVLGERNDDRPYSKRDRALLEKTAAIVGMAIEQDAA
jgi:hypothetical protein